jgi:beta-galactosidase
MARGRLPHLALLLLLATTTSTATTAAAAAAPTFPPPSTLTLGVDYYPEAWSPSQWAVDAAAMAAAGIRTVRVAEFAWHMVQPDASSTYSWAWLDAALDVLAAHNISAIVGTPTASPPSWLIQSDPTMQLTDINGDVLRYGSRQGINHVHAGFREATVAIVAALADHYADDDRVIAFQVDNEIHGEFDYSPLTLSAFQQWLGVKYGDDIANLNAAWGTVFWSHTYNAFEDVPLPWNTLYTSHNPGLALDFRRFLADVGGDYLELQVSVLRAHAPLKAITHNCMGLYPNVDYSRFGAALDAVSFDAYPIDNTAAAYPISEGTVYAAATGSAMMRAAKGGQPFFVMEMQASNTGQAFYYGSGYVELYRAFAYAQVANGADGVQFFRWRTTRVGFEQHWEGVLNWDGSTSTRRYANVVRIGKEFAAIGPSVAGTRVRARVAVLHSVETRWAFAEQGLTSTSFDPIPQTEAYLAAFRANQVGVDVVYIPADTGDGDSFSSLSSIAARRAQLAANLSAYDVVLAPTLWVVPDVVAGALDDYVAAGGHLLLTMRSGSKTSTNAYTNLTLPGPFAGLAGVAINEWDPMCSLGENSISLTLGDDSSAAPGAATTTSYLVDTVQGRICEVLEPSTATVIGTYASGYHAGKAAVTHNVVGAKGGTVVYVGSVSSDPAFYEALAGLLAADAGLAFGPRLPTAVEVSVRDGVAPSTARCVFVINYNAGPANATVPIAGGGTDLLTGQIVGAGGVMALAPWQVAVVATTQ